MLDIPIAWHFDTVMNKSRKTIALVFCAGFALLEMQVDSRSQGAPQASIEPISIVIYKDRLDQSEQFANALIYRHRESFRAVSHFYPLGNANRLIVENSFIVGTAPIDDVTSRNLIDDADAQALEEKRVQLAGIAKRCEKAAAILRPILDTLAQFSKMKADGNVLYSGKWMTRKNYDAFIATELQVAREKQLAFEKEAEQRRMASAKVIAAEQTARESARKKAGEEMRRQVQTYTSAVNALIKAPGVTFRSNLEVWAPLESETVQNANDLLRKGQELLKSAGQDTESINKCLQDLTVLVNSSEAAAAWQGGDGETAAKALNKLSIPNKSSANEELASCWVSLLRIREDINKRLEESDKNIRAYYDALARNKTVDATRHLELALQFIPNPRMQAKLADLRKNSLGL